MINYSQLLNSYVTNINDTVVVNFGEDSFTEGGGSANITQSVFNGVIQGQELFANNSSDASGVRLVQVCEFVAGNITTDTSLDFDLVDETVFLQEDASGGTDFIDGKVILHSTGYSGGTYGVDICTGGSISASSSYDGYPASYAVDNLLTAESMWGSGTTSGLTWLKYALPIAKLVGKYRIYYPYNSLNWPSLSYSPDAWSFQGSNNNVDWATLDSRTDQKWTAYNVWKEYTVASYTMPYLYYRLLFTQTNYLALGEIEFIEWLPTAVYITGNKWITTSDYNHISLADVESINYTTVDSTEPTDTSINALVSFDGRNSWKKYDTGWVTVSGMDFTGSTISSIETGLTATTVTNDMTYLDLAFQLVSSTTTATPEITQITVNYTEKGTYVVKYPSEYSVENYSATQTRITKLSSGTNNIKVNILV